LIIGEWIIDHSCPVIPAAIVHRCVAHFYFCFFIQQINAAAKLFSGKFKRCQQENIFPAAFVDPVGEVAEQRHGVNLLTFYYNRSQTLFAGTAVRA